MPVSPDYAGPQLPPPPSPWLYRLALFFTIAPLVTGVSILVLYVLTESNLWIDLGLMTLVLGALSVVVALMLVGVYGILVTGRRCDEGVVSAMRSRVKRVALMAVLNLLAAFGCAAFGMWYSNKVWMTQTIIVTNAGKTPVTSAVIEGAGVKVDVGPVGPGATVTRKVNISRDGQMTYDVTVGGEHVNGIAAGDVIQGIPGTHRITVNDGHVVVSP